jgi:hypothetical protein
MSDLEDTFPYTILRTANLSLTLEQTEGAQWFASSMDDDKEDE